MEKKIKGFTLIEITLYVAIMTIVIASVVPFAWNVIINSVKSSYQEEVYSNGRFLSEKIKYEIRNAKGINSVNTDNISLVNFDIAKDPTLINLSGGKIRIKYGTNAYINLNSEDTVVTNLVFTNNSSLDNKTKNISFSFTISSLYSGTRQEYIETMDIKSTAEVRSN